MSYSLVTDEQIDGQNYSNGISNLSFRNCHTQRGFYFDTVIVFNDNGVVVIDINYYQ